MGGGIVTGSYPPPESLRPTLLGDHWGVVAGHPLVAEVAADILRRGGNAVDAGVAAGLASNVVQADMANFGGIAPILVRKGTSTDVFAVCGVGVWGEGARPDALMARFGPELQGVGPCIVPGAPAGWIRTLTDFGTWSFADVVAPAVDLALNGFPLDHRTAVSLQIMGRTFRAWEQTALIYWPQGRPPRASECLVQRDLGRLLASLASAEQGHNRRERLRSVHRAFYEGDPARQITAFVRRGGGFLSESDLAAHEAVVSAAPAICAGSWKYHSTPAWSQGPLVLQILGILEHAGLRDEPHNSERYLHLLAEAVKLAFLDRELYYADPFATGFDVGELLQTEHLAGLAAKIDQQAMRTSERWRRPARRLGSTTAIVVVDRDGNAFAAAPSDTLDGSPIIPGLGILCSPRGVQSRLDPDHPNVAAPGKRPCVTPSAVIAVPARQVAPDPSAWALACPGGDVIVQALTQVILNCTLTEMTMQEAVEAARIAVFDFPGAFAPHPEAERVLFAEDRIEPHVLARLAQRGHEVRQWPAFEFDAGSVQTACYANVIDHAQGAGGEATQRVISAAADPRRSAYALVR